MSKKTKSTSNSNQSETIVLNQIATDAIAGIINSAFETGLNPSWFEVKSLNENGFLDSAFACRMPLENGNFIEGFDTPSGKPAQLNWTLTARLNADGVNESEEADTDWVTVSAKDIFLRWKSFADNPDKSTYARNVARNYIDYVLKMNDGDYKFAYYIWKEGNWDGVSDDMMAQIAIGGDCIFG